MCVLKYPICIDREGVILKFTKIYISYEDKNVLIIYDIHRNILYYNVTHIDNAKLIVLV